MENLNAEQIIKAWECCAYGGDVTKSQVEVCLPCPYFNEGNCTDVLKENALALIKQLARERDHYLLTLEGVMLFVDKWLDGDELEQDEVNRAATMREKTLRIVEKLTAENERLHASCTELTRVQAENERLRELATTKEIEKEIVRRETRAAAVKEMAERVKAMKFTHKAFGELVCVEDIDQTAKEMLEGKKMIEQGAHKSWLLACPCGDGNFKIHLKAATDGDIQEVISLLPEKGNKSKIAALIAELKRRRKKNED